MSPGGNDVDIEGFLQSISTFDLLVAFGLGVFFILGFIQGIVRRLLGIASILFSFFVAALLRPTLGDFLVTNWNTFPPEYSKTIAFGTVFVAASIAFTIAIQVFYKPVPLFPRYPVADEILGGLLGVLQGLIIIGAIIVILDPFYQLPGNKAFVGEVGLLRSFHELLDPSATASFFRDHLIPGFFAFFGALFPDDVRAVFPGAT
jgi:uncharacterized membrane protein required for colicin V production